MDCIFSPRNFRSIGSLSMNQQKKLDQTPVPVYETGTLASPKVSLRLKEAGLDAQSLGLYTCMSVRCL